MTDLMTPTEPDEPSHHSSPKRSIALVVTALVALGVGAWLVIWWRGGGARRAITELAEQGAVKLADALIDEVLPAA